MNIDNTFSGYINIEDDTFVYHVNGSFITLLPAEKNLRKQHEAIERVRGREEKLPEYFYGTHGLTNIAIMHNSAFSFSTLGIDPVISFSTPVIIKAGGNAAGFYNRLTDEWTKFHSITFYGGNINSVFYPERALKPECSGKIGIDFLPHNDYTNSINFIIKENTKVTLTVSVFRSWSRHLTGRRGAYSLGELDASICLSFEEPQDFYSLVDYYRIIKSLISILVGQNNISFDTFVCQKTKDNEDILTATCKIFDSYENYAKVDHFRAIPINYLFDYIPQIIEEISKNKTDPLLVLLPTKNREISRISITNIQDMCAALEAAYPKNKRKKDILIKELIKDIKKTITDFSKTHDNFMIYNLTTISNCFKNLDFTLTQKILTLYEENRKFIDPIIQRRKLPQINEENVRNFVKLRNNKAHGSIFEFGNCVHIYLGLLAIVYVQLFKEVGVPDDTIEKIVEQIF